MSEDEPQISVTDEYYYDLISKGQMIRSWYFFSKLDGVMGWGDWDLFLGRVFGKICFNLYTPFFSCGYAWGAANPTEGEEV